VAHEASDDTTMSGSRMGASYCEHRRVMLRWCQVKRSAAVAEVARSEVARGPQPPTQARGVLGPSEDAAMRSQFVAVQLTPKALTLLRNHGLSSCCLTFELSRPRRQAA
jgi:hypothetical protein